MAMTLNLGITGQSSCIRGNIEVLLGRINLSSCAITQPSNSNGSEYLASQRVVPSKESWDSSRADSV